MKNDDGLIRVDVPLGQIAFTPKELAEEIASLSFLREAMFVVLAPELCSKSWDFEFGKEETLQFLENMYLKELKGYNKDFIEKVFIEARKNMPTT